MLCLIVLVVDFSCRYIYRPSNPSVRRTNAIIAIECAMIQEKEANASAPCNDDSSEKVLIAGYKTKNTPDIIRVIAAK